MKRIIVPLIATTMLALLPACSSVPKDSHVAHDPWENYNRSMYAFNNAADKALIQPLAKGYQAVTPDIVEQGIGNVFTNIGEIPDTLNNLLQGQLKDAAITTSRFLINSTLGIYGIFDVATAFNLKEKDEDFGQTLAQWGVASGPYLVLPFLGPSTLRDTTGTLVDSQTDPLSELSHKESRNWAYALQLIHTRAGLLSATDFMNDAALDPYVFLRESYLLQRQNVIADGAVPESSEEEDALFDN